MPIKLQLSEAKKAWNTALSKETTPYPFYTYAWHTAWQHCLAPQTNVSVYTNNDHSVIVPCVKEHNTLSFSGGSSISDYQDAIGDPSHKNIFWNELFTLWKSENVTQVILTNVPVTSPTITVLKHVGLQQTISDMIPILGLPDTKITYINSLDRKSRHELRRKLRKFEADYPDISCVIDHEADIPSLLALMALNQKKSLFLTDGLKSFFSQLPLLSDVDILQASLFDHDKIISTVIAFRIQKQLLLYNSGFDPSYGGAGFYLKAQTIFWAIDHDYTLYNFLRGNEQYKYDFGAKDSLVYRVTVSL